MNTATEKVKLIRQKTTVQKATAPEILLSGDDTDAFPLKALLPLFMVTSLNKHQVIKKTNKKKNQSKQY